MILYSKEINERLKDGTERTLYKPLGNFLESFTKTQFKKEISAIAEQSSKNYKKGVGFPDITIKENGFTLGYIEVKLPTDNIDDKKFKEQFDRYKGSLENIIFTNLKIWQLWQWDKEGNAKKVKEIIFDYASPKEEDFLKLFEIFIHFSIIQASTPKQLAVNLAKRTKLLATLLTEILEDETQNTLLLSTKEAFKTTLLHDIDDKSFTNLIAETFTYSLFIATLEHFESGKQDEMTLTTAVDFIPRTIPVLNDLYQLAQNLSKQIFDIKESVELILKELNGCAIEKIRNSFYKENSGNEPTLYFYETFLKEYDKETKKKRGAYYTPKPVVDFIVKSVDTLLSENFGLKEGIMTKEVKLLDPATGTGTFLASSIELIKRKIDKKYAILNLEKQQFITEVASHILHNFYGFEFMIAPYTVAHLKLTLLLKTLGFDFEMTKNDNDPDNDRFKVYLANTLDDPNKEPNSLFGFSHISEESKKAKAVKNQKDIIAIIGNPPYSNFSGNKGEWILSKIADYKKDLNEKKINLDDDYIKFIRFAQYLIQESGFGVVGMISNNSFLDGITHRKMRENLLGTFDKIYVLNLHGSHLKKEPCVNVFDIQIGVAIWFFVKLKKPLHVKELYYASTLSQGILSREEKFDYLAKGQIEWTKLNPQAPNFWFVAKEEGELEDYSKFWGLTEIFKEYNSGIQTKRDSLTIHYRKEDLIKVLKDMKELEIEEIRQKYHLPEDGRDWTIEKAKESIIKKFEEKITQIDYRPFDTRWTYYHAKSKGFLAYPRNDINKHCIDESNMGLLFRKQAPKDFTYVLITSYIISEGILGIDNMGREYLAPLYLYNKNESSFFGENKTTNFTDAFKAYQKEHLSGFSDEQIFFYMYGLLYAPSYRTRYNEFLKTDFPRIDFGYDIATISKLGEELTQLHLLTHPIFEEQDTWDLHVNGEDYTIHFARKADIYKEGKLYLNENTYISGVNEEVFKFMIGGYHVLDKWLSDRKNTILTLDELMHYLKIIVSLKETIRVMREIDEVVNISK